MICVSNSCNQGRQPCPTPWQCAGTVPSGGFGVGGSVGDNGHRYTPPITKEGFAVIEFEDRRNPPITRYDDEDNGLCRALLVTVYLAVAGIVLLPFLIGAV